jgi:hypothetical protein
VLWSKLADRLAANKWWSPEKTKIVYCKDANRRADFPEPIVRFSRFQFPSEENDVARYPAHGFMPAASPKALTAIRQSSHSVGKFTIRFGNSKPIHARYCHRLLPPFPCDACD